MDRDEFVEAIWHLKRSVVVVLMQKMGLTLPKLLAAFIKGMLVILVLFSFILTVLYAYH